MVKFLCPIVKNHKSNHNISPKDIKECVAIGLGFERERERNGNITKTIRWDNIKKYLSEIDDRYLTQEVGLDLFILESDFYELAMVAKSETAKAFRKKIAKEILPAIRKHGAYISENATPEQLDHLMENQIVEFYTGGGERSAQRIRQLIFDKKFDNLDLIKSFNYIYDRLSSSYRGAFIKSFKLLWTRHTIVFSLEMIRR